MPASDSPLPAPASGLAPGRGRYPLAGGGAVAAALERGPGRRENARSCQALWRSVLHVALVDERKNPGWVGSGDYYMVCALAGLDGEAVLDRWEKGFALPAQRSRAIIGQDG